MVSTIFNFILHWHQKSLPLPRAERRNSSCALLDQICLGSLIGAFQNYRRRLSKGSYHKDILIVQANADNLLTATITGKRKREVGLVVPAKFTAFAQELKKANILKRELNERAS